MATAFLVFGILLLALAIVDALWTTLWVDGSGGPLASRLTTWMWRGMKALGGRHHQAMSLAGPTILASTVVIWVVLMWAGWVLVFASEPSALLSTRDYASYADWPGRIFFVAYSVFTMGNGDFVPNGGAWQVAASVATGSGFFLASLVISYLLAVVSAVVAKRAFAGQVSALGHSAEELLARAWNGRDFHTLDLPLNMLSGALSDLTERYIAYPILQYYHAGRPSKSPVVAVVILDEALTLLRYGVPEEARPNVALLNAARSSVATYLDTLPSAFIDPALETPPPPDLAKLRERGIPTVSDEAFARALGELGDRRRRLLGLLRNDGWRWREEEP